MTDTAIQIQDLSFAYDGSIVLEGVDLSIPVRDFVCFVGPNGGGKTTLLKLIVGLLTPREGRITVLGTDPVSARPRIGYMPQRAYVDPRFPMTVMDVALMGRVGAGRPVGPYGRANRMKAEAALEEVGIADLSRRPFSSLSGGQQQRAFLARALACEPEILLLDEPMANLDLAVESEILNLLRQLNERLTVVLVSHDFGFVSRLTKRIVCVNRVVRSHPTAEITAEILREMYGEEVQMVRHDRHGPGRRPGQGV
jgi:zinc transport system ATP-binding protein